MKPVPPVTKTFTARKPIRPGRLPTISLSATFEKRPQDADAQRRDGVNGAGVSNPRARQRALAIGIVDGARGAAIRWPS